MRLGVAVSHRRRLARGAALLVLGGLAAGCSSDVTRFQDSILTGSSRAPVQAAQVDPVNQPFPGDVDRTYTGSVSAQPAQRQNGGILGRAGLLPRPAADVGRQGSLASAAGQAATQQQTQAVPAGVVSQGPALTPVSRGQLDTTVTGSTRAVQQAQPVEQARQEQQSGRQPRVGGWSSEGGSRVTTREGDTLATLSRRYNVPEDAIRQANGMSANQQIAAGSTVVIPTFSQPGGRQPTDRQQQEPNQLGVLPQQPKVQERDTASANAQSGASSSDAAPSPGGTYKVAAGDTLSGISRRSGVSVQALKAANGLSDGLIRIGQELTIPAGGQVPSQTASDPQPAQTQTAARDVPANVDPIVTGGASTGNGEQRAGASSSEGTIATSSIPPQEVQPESSTAAMRWPAQGRVISGFGASSGGKTNDGIDISVPEGTSVRAAEGGVVIYAGDGLREFGNTVLVRHDGGLVTVYGHNSQIKVSRGDTVRRGQEIALSGKTGSAETPRLHFEVRKDSTPVDPMTFLE
jgi:murein DD-endopeptidase MepM/ murein hydrolase activator NlpD